MDGFDETSPFPSDRFKRSQHCFVEPAKGPPTESLRNGNSKMVRNPISFTVSVLLYHVRKLAQTPFYEHRQQEVRRRSPSVR